MDKLRVVFTVDVEEEGLFTGRYPRRPRGLANVAHLERLEFITRRHGLPLTLLATYPVINHPDCRRVLLFWRDQLGAELGAHLHPWNTPPFGPAELPEPHLAADIAPGRLRQKLASLLQAHADLLGAPARSFRMGRFDLPPELMAALPELGIKVDSSLVPLRTTMQGPDHFTCPVEPHRPSGGRGRPLPLCEAPLTLVPQLAGSQRVVAALARRLPPAAGRRLKVIYRHLGVVGVQPSMFSAAAMRRAARLHHSRGGRTLVMYLHSSELMPGATPAYPHQAAVAKLVDKIARFLVWLSDKYEIKGRRLSELA